jgi:hypothetical protein
MARIVVLTGAGISAESGLGTFRDEGGLWSQYDLEEVATPQGFRRNPALVQNSTTPGAATAPRRGRTRRTTRSPGWKRRCPGRCCWSRRTSMTCTIAPGRGR